MSPPGMLQGNYSDSKSVSQGQCRNQFLASTVGWPSSDKSSIRIANPWRRLVMLFAKIFQLFSFLIDFFWRITKSIQFQWTLIAIHSAGGADSENNYRGVFKNKFYVVLWNGSQSAPSLWIRFRSNHKLPIARDNWQNRKDQQEGHATNGPTNKPSEEWLTQSAVASAYTLLDFNCFPVGLPSFLLLSPFLLQSKSGNARISPKRAQPHARSPKSISGGFLVAKISFPIIRMRQKHSTDVSAAKLWVAH